MARVVFALVLCLLVPAAAASGQRPRPGRRARSRPRSPRQPADRADRPRVGDPEDQGRRGHARGGHGPGGVRAQPPDRSPAAAPAAASGPARRSDEAEERGSEHGEHRAGADRERRRCCAVPADPRRRIDRSERPWDPHAVPRAPSWLDGRRVRREPARGTDRPGRARPHARLPGPGPPGAVRLHRLQLGGRARDPRRAGVHDEPDRRPAPRVTCRTSTVRQSGSAGAPFGSSTARATTAAEVQRQSTETTSTGCSRPFSFSVRGSDNRTTVPMPSSVSVETRISPPLAAAPMRAATCTPWPP